MPKKFDTTKDYYQILEISAKASTKEIQAAYKTLVNKYHPDKHQGNILEELAKEKLTLINEAYLVLSKPGLREEYDLARAGFVPNHQKGGNYCSPSAPPKVGVKNLAQFLFLIVVLLTLPLLMRIIKSPKTALVLGLAILLAWFGPRILKLFKKK